MVTAEGGTWPDTTTEPRAPASTSTSLGRSGAARPSPSLLTPTDGTIPATQVNYEDRREKRNSSLQVSWNEWMSEGIPRSPIYKHVAALLISWKAEDDDLKVQNEVKVTLCPKILL